MILYFTLLAPVVLATSAALGIGMARLALHELRKDC